MGAAQTPAPAGATSGLDGQGPPDTHVLRRLKVVVPVRHASPDQEGGVAGQVRQRPIATKENDTKALLQLHGAV